MRRLALASVPLVAAAALAQEAPKPAPAPVAPAQVKAAEPARTVEFVGADAIRKADGMVVHYYHVNYVSADILAQELKTWTTPKGTVQSQGGTSYSAAPISPERQAKVPGAQPGVQTTLRIEDTDENWPVLRHILDIIDVPQGQVYIDAKIIEVTYTDDLRLGMEAHIKRSLADTFFQGTDIKFPNRLDAVNQFTTAFHEASKYATFDYIVDLAEAGAKTTVRSKPGVFASQGETAVIRVGDREPIVQQTLNGNSISATTILQDTGLRLEVQPLLIGREGVRARISCEVSRVSDFRVTATSQNLQVVNPVISTRNADTVLTVPDGEVVVIGGLDQDFDREQTDGIPLLKDLPVIGVLFGSTTKRKEHTELVFFLTFSIRSPNEARVVKPPSEMERIGK